MAIQTLLHMALVLASATGLSFLPQDTTKETCEAVMNRNGLNFSTFRHGAAHGVHSIYLEEIRHFFEPEALANNKIPVVNTNMSAEQMILFDSPMAGYDKNFNTLALQVMAFFMLNDFPNFYQQGTNTLEKIAHQYHMHEIYAAAGPIYHRMKADPPTDPKLCLCVNDIAVNGILTEMHNIANQLKNFAITPWAEKCPTHMNKPEPELDYDYKKKPVVPKWGFDYDYKKKPVAPKWGFDYDYKKKPVAPKWGFDYDYKKKPVAPKWGFDYDYKKKPVARKWGFDYDYKKKPVEPKWGFDYDYKKTTRCRPMSTPDSNTNPEWIAQYKEVYLKESSRQNAEKVLSIDPWMPNTLAGPEQWISYEAMLTYSMLEEEELNDFATFIYCKLNEPELDILPNQFE